MSIDVWEVLCAAFEKSGGTGHDLGDDGVRAIVNAWERIRETSEAKRWLEERGLEIW